MIPAHWDLNWRDNYYFDEVEHIYYYKDKPMANVSTILAETLFKGKYAGIPKPIMDRAADFGTNVHDAIENEFPFGLNTLEYQVYNNWLGLKEKHFIIELEKEQPIFHQDFEYMGRFDLVALVMGDKSLCDYKTTYELDLEYISWQLSLYYWAKRDFTITKLYAIWLPKRQKGDVVEVELKSEAQVKWLLEKYHKEKENERIN